MINKAIILGRIGKKEFKILGNSASVCKLSIATNKKYRDTNGQKQDITTWHYVNLFNKLSEIANKHAHVGDLIYIEGEIVNKTVEDKTYSSITAHEIKFIPSGKPKPEANGNVADEKFDDEIPF